MPDGVARTHAHPGLRDPIRHVRVDGDRLDSERLGPDGVVEAARRVVSEDGVALTVKDTLPDGAVRIAVYRRSAG